MKNLLLLLIGFFLMSSISAQDSLTCEDKRIKDHLTSNYWVRFAGQGADYNVEVEFKFYRNNTFQTMNYKGDLSAGHYYILGCDTIETESGALEAVKIVFQTSGEDDVLVHIPMDNQNKIMMGNFMVLRIGDKGESLFENGAWYKDE